MMITTVESSTDVRYIEVHILYHGWCIVTIIVVFEALLHEIFRNPEISGLIISIING